MATLEKIRSKSVLLVVIIAVALLAFILGDAITNGRNLFGNNTTVAKIGKEKIDYQEYQQQRQRVDEMRRMDTYNRMGINDDQEVAQAALEALVGEKLLDKAVDNLGIRTTPELLRYYMLEDPGFMLPEMQTFIANMQQMGLPVSTPAQAYQLITQPTAFGLTDRQVEPLMKSWVALESKYAQEANRQQYRELLFNSYKANDLDLAAMRRYAENSVNVKVAKKAYEEADIKKNKASDDELKKAYDENKEMFKLRETAKEISFIAVEVNPSAKDVEASKALAAKVEKSLKNNEPVKESGVNVQSFATVPSKVTDASLRIFLENAKVDSVACLSTVNGFTVAKLTKRSFDVDSVKVASLVMADNPAFVNKVLAYTTSGQPLDSIMAKFSPDSLMYSSQDVDFYNGAQSFPKYLGLDKAKYDSLNNNVGKFIEIEKNQGMVAYASILEKGSFKTVADYELVNYELHPSEATLEQARANLQKFLDKNNTAEAFEKNAKAAKYNVEELQITSSTPAIPRGMMGYYPDSRAVVHWAMVNGKDGEVSKIFQNRDVNHPILYAVAVDGTYKDYLPVESRVVKNALTEKIQRQKAGDSYAKQYAKGTVEESATAMGTETNDFTGITGQGNHIITDARVRGRIMGTKPSGKVQTVKGDDGVYVFVVTEATGEPVKLSDEQLRSQAQQLYVRQLNDILIGNKKFENNIFKFEAEE